MRDIITLHVTTPRGKDARHSDADIKILRRVLRDMLLR